MKREESPCPPTTTTRPVDIATGNKILGETDFAVLPEGFAALAISRSYDKSVNRIGIIGAKWTISVELTLNLDYNGVQCNGSLTSVSACAPGTNPLTTIYAMRSSGYAWVFSKDANGVWKSPNGSTIAQNGSGWQLNRRDGTIEQYDANRRPISVKDNRGIGLTYVYVNNVLSAINHTSGRSVQFTFVSGKISSIVAPNSKTYGYSYNSQGYLSTVTYPDNLGVRVYHYEDSANPGGLTGITMSGERFSRYAYQPNGKAASSGLEGGVEKSIFSYTTTYTDVTNPYNQKVRYQIGDFNGAKRVVSVETPASLICPAGAKTTMFDVNGDVDYQLDAFGVKTDYTYDSYHRLIQKKRGIGPNGETNEQQITEFEWDFVNLDRLRKEKVYGASVSAPISETVYEYWPSGDPRSNLLRSISIFNRKTIGLTGTARVTLYDYQVYANGVVQSMTVDGPVSGAQDAIRYDYDSAGNLTSVKNSAGYGTSYSNFNSLGQAGRETGPNGATVDRTFNARGSLLTSALTANGVISTVANTYDTHGRLATSSLPSGDLYTYSYDALDRLVEVSRLDVHEVTPGQDYDETYDVWSKQKFTYDLLSNVNRKELQHYSELRSWDETRQKPLVVRNIYDQDISTFDYDEGGKLKAIRGNNGQSQNMTYNENGDMKFSIDSLGHGTAFTYTRQRWIKTATDSSNTATTFDYTPTGLVASVIDTRGNATTYAYDGFGDLWTRSSPDTGTTQFQFNNAGLLDNELRADGKRLVYHYDGFGRISQIVSGSGIRSYFFDTCSNGKLLLCATSTTDASVTQTQNVYGYTQDGILNVEMDVASPGGPQNWTTYEFNTSGRPKKINYPSGIVVNYGYNKSAVNSVEVVAGGVTKTVAFGMAYLPFETGVVSLTYGNSLRRIVNRDTDGRMTGISTALSADIKQSLTYSFYSDNAVKAVTNGVDATLGHNYQYDALGRLSRDAGPGDAWVVNDVYDVNGNRSSRVRYDSGSLTSSTTYTSPTTSNYLTGSSGSFPALLNYNPQGNLQSSTGWQGNRSYGYDQFDRLKYTNVAGVQTNYLVNGADQRVYKKTGSVATRFTYKSQNQLLNEATDGVGWKSYVWLGNELIGVVQPNNALAYVHTDNLARPQVATNDQRQVVWKANNLSYNRNVLTDNIGGIGLGFPGQYWDVETSTWYNGYRDYDPFSGRYIQSDPVGLDSGSNTYTYALGNPISLADPRGLDIWLEGPNENEVPLHMSVSVGDPNGIYHSFSFAWNGNGLQGEVYYDAERPGKILDYKYTTEEQDVEFLNKMFGMVGEKATYFVDDTCRSWSEQQFRDAPGLRGSPPPVPMKWR